MKSKDMNTTEAQAEIRAINNPDLLRAFIEGDERKTVIEAGEARLRMLTKQGSADNAPDTQKDFKGSGVEGRKEPIQIDKDHITISDILPEARKRGMKI